MTAGFPHVFRPGLDKALEGAAGSAAESLVT